MLLIEIIMVFRTVFSLIVITFCKWWKAPKLLGIAVLIKKKKINEQGSTWRYTATTTRNCKHTI